MNSPDRSPSTRRLTNVSAGTLGVEEIGRAQVCVALRLARIDAGGRNLDVDAAAGGSASSSTAVPVTFVNSPRTVPIMRCFTANPTWLWAESMVQVAVAVLDGSGGHVFELLNEGQRLAAGA